MSSNMPSIDHEDLRHIRHKAEDHCIHHEIEQEETSLGRPTWSPTASFLVTPSPLSETHKGLVAP
jgi:hypothetical protein